MPPIRGKIRRDLTGGISGKGKRGIATFSVEIQAIVFIPRNVPIHPFGQPSGHPGKRPCPFSETGASPQGKGWRFSGKRWECRYTNREKAGCRSGNGYIPVQSEGRLRERCGKSSGVRLTLRSPESRGGVSFPLVQLLNSILPDHPRVSSDFSRFSGRRKFCPPALRRA